ncbi:hypothetical protein AVEN_221973-1 [Araneus ventricosus]|uniref:Uncharacterized protein n=1 Tax=Araneus ventricosus TaxID=182803 RepID=A0A4Y2F6B0_ARAVE|nr:hypothetical protein AVEN_221973-1 [Araneus ventricosus]
MWTDSEICLHWIKSSATEWKQFVSNRVVEIQDCVVPDRWFHCPGLENPAGRLTRGVSAVSLKSDDLWWSGHRWLKSPRYDWLQQKFKVPDEFSSLTRLLRVAAYVLRFLGKLGGRSTQTGAYSVSKTALLVLTKAAAEHSSSMNMRVNYVCPAIINTKFSSVIVSSDESLELLKQIVPMQRVVKPDECYQYGVENWCYLPN